jgi:hypothetical protein
MVLLQSIITAAQQTAGTAFLSCNLPNGMYQMRLVNIEYVDSSTASTAVKTLCSVQSQTWRIPYGSQAQGNTVFFISNNINGRQAPNGSYNWLAEIRNGIMDLTMTVGTGFVLCVLTFDVMPSNDYTPNNFFSLIP